MNAPLTAIYQAAHPSVLTASNKKNEFFRINALKIGSEKEELELLMTSCSHQHTSHLSYKKSLGIEWPNKISSIIIKSHHQPNIELLYLLRLCKARHEKSSKTNPTYMIKKAKILIKFKSKRFRLKSHHPMVTF